MTSPPESMTHAQLDEIWRQLMLYVPLPFESAIRLIEEIKRLWDREEFLLNANNILTAQRQKFEDDANQSHCETLLLRAECIRLRTRHQELAAFIEERHGNALEPPPDEIIEAMEDVFPPEAEDPKVAARKVLDRITELMGSEIPQALAVAILQVQEEVAAQ